MSGKDDTEARRARLRALRNKHPQKIESADTVNETGESPEAPQSSLGEVPDEAPRRGGGMAARRGRRGAGGRRGGAGGQFSGGSEGRGEMLKRLHTFLTQPGPGGRLIPGTGVKEDRLKQVMQFLRHRAAMDEGKQAKRLQRVLSFLAEQEEGVTMVAGVNPGKLQRFVEILGARVNAPATEAAGDDLDGVFDQFIAEEESGEAQGAEVPTPQTAPAPATPSIEELMDLTRQLGSQLAETQRQMAEMMLAQQAGGQPHSPEVGAAEAAPKKAKRPAKGPNADWFSEFLE